MSFNVVITGASGFIGTELLCQLHENKVAVRGWTRQKIDGLSTVRSYSDIPLSHDSVLVHLAQPSDVSDASTGHEIGLCKHLVSKSWQHIIYASSAVVYGDKEQYPRRPDETLTPWNDYSKVKLACEEIIQEAGGTCLRLSNIYGPGMGKNTVLADILSQVPGRVPLRLRDISPVRDFLWVSDVASCIFAACKMMPGGILNVGSGEAIRIGDLARLVLEAAGESQRKIVSLKPLHNSSNLSLDISSTKSILNWSPAMHIDVGISRLLNT